MSDAGRKVQKDLDIAEYTDPTHDPMIPHTIVLEPGLIVFKIYNGYWYLWPADDRRVAAGSAGSLEKVPPGLGHHQSRDESRLGAGRERSFLSLRQELRESVWRAGVSESAMAEHTLQSIAFPVLDADQIAQLANCATVAPKQYRDGETLIHVGDRLFKFFIVKSGEIEILDYSGDAPKTIAVHRKGQFTGDISHLTGAPAIITAIARGDCEVFEVSGEALRHVLNQCPGLSDIILQAFIARRQLLRESPNFIGLRVIGSRYSPDTFRVRDFLARNRVLFTWVDLETDPAGGSPAERVRRDRGRYAGGGLRAYAAVAQSIEPELGG